MRVPESILNVPRPDYTSVYVYGKLNDCYGVRCTDKNSSSFGKTVGHIKDSVYVPAAGSSVPELKNQLSDYKNWGEVCLADVLLKDIYFDLQDYFSTLDAQLIYVLAILRTCNPDITDHQLKSEYEKSFLSEWYPALSLCKDNVSEFLKLLGSHYGSIRKYMQHRVENIKIDDSLVIDGTLKTNDSGVNTFSAFSRKGRIKNRNDYSLLYAYSLESGEPVCSECFPGNMDDSSSGERFIKDHKIDRGFLVTDKGFPPGTLRDYIEEKPDLHYLIPLKRGAKEVEELSLLEFEGALAEYEGVLYKKAEVHQLLNEHGAVVAREIYSGDHVLKESRIDMLGYLQKIWPTSDQASSFTQELLDKNLVKDPETGAVLASKRVLYYYSFVDPYIEYREVRGWIARERRNGINGPEDFFKAYKNTKEEAGTIVFESDLDMSCDLAYETFDSRWQIEVLMKYYKQFCGLEKVREHNDFSLIGSEFINFFSSLLGIRFENYIRKNGVKNKSGRDVIRILRRAKKLNIDGTWSLAPMASNEAELLRAMGLLPKPEPKKCGRPAKNKKDTVLKKKVGRPCKNRDDDPPRLRYDKPGRPSAEEREKAEKRYQAEKAEWKAKHPERYLA